MTVTRPAGAEFDPSSTRLRSAFSCFATGITVVATGGSSPSAMTANSFTSVSLDPPLVLVCVRVNAVFHSSIQEFGAYSVNVLSSEQQDIARHFANPARHVAGAEFARGRWAAGANTGAPLLDQAHAWLECTLDQTYDGGDHSIFVGRVLDFDLDSDKEPLLFYGGGYHNFDLTNPARPH